MIPTSEMTDNELITLCAAVIGIQVEFYDTHSIKDVCVIKGNYGPDRYWNPLNNDGDAFKLAVTLGTKYGIDLYLGKKYCVVDGDDSSLFVKEDHKEDPAAATRRAIVLAAAEVGIAMLTMDQFVLLFPYRFSATKVGLAQNKYWSSYFDENKY